MVQYTVDYNELEKAVAVINTKVERPVFLKRNEDGTVQFMQGTRVCLRGTEEELTEAANKMLDGLAG